MDLEFQEYETRKLVNVHKHVDGPWFWGKYTAHPYIGCRHGCEFCYARGGQYAGGRDPETYDTVIRVKVNAVDRLQRELARLEPEIISAGDWQQPAETRYGLSRAMLEVVLECGFPLYVNERSPLLTRDLDLLTAIDERAWVGVSFSLSGVDPRLKRAFEPRSPGVGKRLRAMETLAAAGIAVGASLMPVIPLLGDSRAHLDDTIRAIRDHGGGWVLGGGMTMAGAQADRTLRAARLLQPKIEPRWREFFQWPTGAKPSYGPPGGYNSWLGLTIRELCHVHGIADRIPRHITPGPLQANKRIAEKLFLRTYDLELDGADSRRIWAYRRAAWTVDEHPDSVMDLYQERGTEGLRSLPGIGQRLAGLIATWLKEMANETPVRSARRKPPDPRQSL